MMKPLLVGIGIGLLACALVITALILSNLVSIETSSQLGIWMDVGIVVIALISLGLSRLSLGEKSVRVFGVVLLVAGVILTLTTIPLVAYSCAGMDGCHSSTKPIIVMDGVTSCTPSSTGGVCIVPLENLGGSNTVATACFINVNGIAIQGVMNNTALPINSKVMFSCTISGASPVSAHWQQAESN